MVAKVVILSVLIFLLAVFILWLSRKNSDIHEHLNKLMDRARGAKTDGELVDLSIELIAFADRKCWHRSHSARVREVFAYVQGRRATKVS